MALGKPVLTYLHEEAVRRTEEAFGVELPLVPTSKDTLADDLQRLVDQPELRDEIGLRSRAYVERVHDANAIADRLIGIYETL
jgi:glycosyltransferase involved in cell wall biosynthesis